MDGLNAIIDGTRKMMDELFEGVEDKNGIARSVAKNLGVTNVSAIVEMVLEGGVNADYPYPLIHFHTTLAANIPEEYARNLAVSLNVLNNVICAGAFPSFGCFCYYPKLSQIYLSYRLPVNPEAPDEELVNIQYYLGVLYEELDVFVDYIMFLCDNEGRSSGIDDYLDYINDVNDMNDLEERAEKLTRVIEEMKKDFEENNDEES